MFFFCGNFLIGKKKDDYSQSEHNPGSALEPDRFWTFLLLLLFRCLSQFLQQQSLSSSALLHGIKVDLLCVNSPSKSKKFQNTLTVIGSAGLRIFFFFFFLVVFFFLGYWDAGLIVPVSGYGNSWGRGLLFTKYESYNE